jgi:hypothetical protein
LERPWLKLCFTVPALTDPAPRGFRVRGWRPPEAGVRPLLFSSLMRSLYSSAGDPAKGIEISTRSIRCGCSYFLFCGFHDVKSRGAAGQCPVRP